MFDINLPGSSIHVIDEYNTSVYDSSQFGTTESVLVIGTAFDGPSGKEVAVYNPEHAQYIFGGSYDSKARRSATLTAYVQDLYEKGCRTIYCMRVGGKEISKTYRLREDVPIYFRVSGSFPSNKYKDMAALIHTDESTGARKFTIFKTANKATIEEKREGAVESSESIISVSVDISNPYGIDENSKLSDLIEYMNTYIKNNVFKFALVDEKGVDITHSELAQTLSVGALFDGIYTVGRVNKAESLRHAVPTSLTATLPDVTYAGFGGGVLFELASNDNVEIMYPLVKTNYDFLKQFGGLDTVSQKDDVDYEEVEMTNFELYKKLGSGFAQTAMIKSVSEDGSRVVIKPTPSTHALYTAEIGEGIYTTASNLKTDYRILASGYADDVITGKRPVKEDFLKESINPIPAVFTGASTEKVGAKAVYKLDDESEKKYLFKVNIVPGEEDLKTVSLATLKGKLVPGVTALKDTTTIEAGKYAIVEAENSFWIAEQETGGDAEVKVIMPVSMLGKTNPDFTITVEEGLTHVTYTVSVLDDYAGFTSVGEFAEALKESVVGQVFNIICDNKLVNELIAETPVSHTTPVANRVVRVDENLAIPYTTSDNFARQLAQHCEYTSLKTYQTHGVIGVKPLNDTSIKAVSEKCADLVERDYDLYVKNVVGRPVLGVDNMPYHIGKAITITTMQHVINTMDGYRFVASGQASYTARASVLPASTSTTNQVISITPQFTFGESQKVALNKKGYVTAEYKDGVYKITDGVTKAPIASQFSRFATFRTMKLVDKVIREATEPFIGKKNDMTNRNSMYTAIKSGMDSLLEVHLEKYEFSMNYNKHDARLGEIKIDYTIDIINEIRNVKNTVTAKSE